MVGKVTWQLETVNAIESRMMPEKYMKGQFQYAKFGYSDEDDNTGVHYQPNLRASASSPLIATVYRTREAASTEC